MGIFKFCVGNCSVTLMYTRESLDLYHLVLRYFYVVTVHTVSNSFRILQVLHFLRWWSLFGFTIDSVIPSSVAFKWFDVTLQKIHVFKFSLQPRGGLVFGHSLFWIKSYSESELLTTKSLSFSFPPPPTCMDSNFSEEKVDTIWALNWKVVILLITKKGPSTRK